MAMYVTPNFRTKKALKLALADGQRVGVFQPNDISGTMVPTDGTVYLEGPHYPEPHRWYAVGTMKDGRLVKIR
jgi:hypothetical protein